MRMSFLVYSIYFLNRRPLYLIWTQCLRFSSFSSLLRLHYFNFFFLSYSFRHLFISHKPFLFLLCLTSLLFSYSFLIVFFLIFIFFSYYFTSCATRFFLSFYLVLVSFQHRPVRCHGHISFVCQFSKCSASTCLLVSTNRLSAHIGICAKKKKLHKIECSLSVLMHQRNKKKICMCVIDICEYARAWQKRKT